MISIKEAAAREDLEVRWAITKFLRWLTRLVQPVQVYGGVVVYVVKADNPDVAYSMTFQVADSEGNPITDLTTIKVTFESSDPDVVSILPSDPVHPEAGGMVHFGAPGTAGLVAQVLRASDDMLLGSFGSQFTVTAGDPTAVAGGSITFEGLSESEPPPEPPPVEPPTP